MWGYPVCSSEQVVFYGSRFKSKSKKLYVTAQGAVFAAKQYIHALIRLPMSPHPPVLELAPWA